MDIRAHLVRQNGAQALHDSRGGEVLGGDQLQRSSLTIFFLIWSMPT